MKYDPNIHHRRSIRLKGYDYSQPGAYFITIVTWQHEDLFGEIIDNEMKVNNAGFVAQTELKKLPTMFPELSIDNFVIMPNHAHAIFVLSNPTDNVKAKKDSRDQSSTNPFVRARPEEPSQIENLPFASPLQPFLADVQSHTLGSIVGAYKSTVARIINGLRRTPESPVWQRNYYEHIIRNETDFNHVWDYIDDNPRSWAEDQLFHQYSIQPNNPSDHTQG